METKLINVENNNRQLRLYINSLKTNNRKNNNNLYDIFN